MGIRRYILEHACNPVGDLLAARTAIQVNDFVDRIFVAKIFFSRTTVKNNLAGPGKAIFWIPLNETKAENIGQTGISIKYLLRPYFIIGFDNARLPATDPYIDSMPGMSSFIFLSHPYQLLAKSQ